MAHAPPISSSLVCAPIALGLLALAPFACTSNGLLGGSDDAGAAFFPDAAATGVVVFPDAGASEADASEGTTVSEDGGETVTFAPNPNNALSVVGTVSLPGYVSARVVSRSPSEQLSTPFVALDANGNGRIAVLGLAPSTAYSHVVEMVTSAGATQTFGPVSLTTPALPSALTSVTVPITTGTGAPQPGYYLVTGAGSVDYAFDATGTIRWYAAFGGTLQEGKMQYDGTYTSYVGGSTGSEDAQGDYVRFTPDGTQTTSYAAATPEETDGGPLTMYTDPHELLVTEDDAGAEHLHLLGYERIPTVVDAGATATLSWHELLRQSPSGNVEFRWKASSRFSLPDRVETDLVADFDHANAIAIDPTDGNYVVSFRCLDALVKIDYQTGAVLWQLGGAQNQFTIMGDPLGGFQGQHSVRVLADGDILIYDNGLHHTPPESRAVEYRLDTTANTATMVWEYRRVPVIETQFVGSVERLTNGDTLVAFGLAGVVNEADSSGNLVWEAKLFTGTTARSAYRVRRLPSLYTFETP